MTTTVKSVDRPEEDVWCHVFQGGNTASSQTFLQAGNFFLGLQAYIGLKFTMTTPIPAGAEILSATIDLVAATTNASASPQLPIQGINNADDRAWKFDNFGDAWRTEIWGAFALEVRDDASAPALIVGSPGVTNGSWTLKRILTFNKRMAQLLAIPAGPDPTLGEVRLELSKTGTPTGNLFVEVMSVGVDGQPDEVILATSDAVLASSVAGTAGDVTFPFSGGDQITLTNGVSYFFVLRSTYSQNGVDGVNWHRTSAFLSQGGGKHYGTDSAFGYQNYPGTADVAQEIRANRIGTPILWSVPPSTAGVVQTTPELAALVQEYVNSLDFKNGDPFGFVFDSVGNTGNRRWASFLHATYARPQFTVEWEQPSTPPHRTATGFWPPVNQVRGRFHRWVESGTLAPSIAPATICKPARWTPLIQKKAQHISIIAKLARHTPTIVKGAHFINECIAVATSEGVGVGGFLFSGGVIDTTGGLRWLQLGFSVSSGPPDFTETALGTHILVTGTPLNDGTYVIVSILGPFLTVVGSPFSNETVTAGGEVCLLGPSSQALSKPARHTPTIQKKGRFNEC